MKINFEDKFLSHILKRGYDYFLTDKVKDVIIDDNTVNATVRGTNNYNVTIDLKDNDFIYGTCDCMYYKSGFYCKHIAAVLYYLKGQYKNKSKSYNLKDIINEVDNKKLKEFLYNTLTNNSDLLNDFRVEFNNYFPKLSKENYENKIYTAIHNCGDRYGYIDYTRESLNTSAMYSFIGEAEKLIQEKDYDTAFIILSTILDSIPKTAIDDSNGVTSDIASSCNDFIEEILFKVDSKNEILTKILNFATKEIITQKLYNYSIDLNFILEYFINNNLYLDKIEEALTTSLNKSKEKKYFYNRKHYVDYLRRIYEITDRKDKIIKLLEEYSFDEKVCIEYVDELIKEDKLDYAIETLKRKINEDDRNNMYYANKLESIYLENNMHTEYKNILYDTFYKYDKYNFDIYVKIKKLYPKEEWIKEKNKIINDIKKDNKYYGTNRILNKIFIEEEMYDELFLNVCNSDMSSIEEYEKYLLPKYKNEILNIYKNECLDARYNTSRANYRKHAVKVNKVIQLDDEKEISKSLLQELNEKYFGARTAMLEEFQNIIKNLDDYLK